MTVKRYVAVEVFYDAEGAMRPLRVFWEDGRCFEVLRVTDIRRMASLATGGMGLRYRCIIGQRETNLYFEDPRWFVDARCTK